MKTKSYIWGLYLVLTTVYSVAAQDPNNGGSDANTDKKSTTTTARPRPTTRTTTVLASTTPFVSYPITDPPTDAFFDMTPVTFQTTNKTVNVKSVESEDEIKIEPTNRTVNVRLIERGGVIKIGGDLDDSKDVITFSVNKLQEFTEVEIDHKTVYMALDEERNHFRNFTALNFEKTEDRFPELTALLNATVERLEVHRYIKKALWSTEEKHLGDVEHNLYIFHEAAQLNFNNEIAHVYPGSVLIQTKTSFEFCNDTARDCNGNFGHAVEAVFDVQSGEETSHKQLYPFNGDTVNTYLLGSNFILRIPTQDLGNSTADILSGYPILSQAENKYEIRSRLRRGRGYLTNFIIDYVDTAEFDINKTNGGHVFHLSVLLTVIVCITKLMLL